MKQISKPARPLQQWLSGENRLIAWCAEREYWLSDLQQQIENLSQHWRALPGKRWALCFDDSFSFCVALLAAWYAGKVPCLPGHHRAALLEEMSDQFEGVISDMPLAISLPHLLWPGTPPSQPNVEPRETAEVLPWPQGAAPGSIFAAGQAVHFAALPPDAALVLFTSGSTGTPSAVHKPLALMEREAQLLAQHWGTQLGQCRVVASVSHQHLFGLTFRLFLPLALGLPFACRQVLSSEQLLAQAQVYRTLFITSPTFLQHLDAELPLPNAVLTLSAGGVLPWQDAQRARLILGGEIAEIYGSSETGVIATRSTVQRQLAWRCFSGVRLEAMAAQRWRVYSDLIEDAAGWPLDDRLAVAADGSFQLKGRHDRIVKIADKRISLSEIERRLLAQPGIRAVAVLPLQRHGRSAIAAVIVLEKTVPPEQHGRLKQHWRHQLQPLLEPVALPRYWRIVPQIPLNSQSKCDWAQMEALFDAGVAPLRTGLNRETDDVAD